MRHSPIRGELDALIASGQLGELTNGYARFVAGPPDRYLRANSAWLLDPAQSGGGCAINLGVHFVDLFMQLVGQRRFERVYAMPSHRKYALAVEDFSTVVLSTTDGVACTIETGYAYPSIPGQQRHFACCLTTTKGYLELREGAYSWAGHDGRRFERPVVTETDTYYPVFINHTLDAFRTGRPPAASTGEMLDVMRVLDAAYESGRRGEAVRP
jgi:predicted dehydrogenase